jgi:steroid 5-alpha reductase family enzyme
MSVWFIVGVRRSRLDVVDTAWGGGFMLIATISLLAEWNFRTFVIWLLVMIWGLRLASHLWKRSNTQKPDPRYEELSAKWPKHQFWLQAYFRIFILQGLLVVGISLPIMVAASESEKLNVAVAIIGVLIWLEGYLIESYADKQLAEFKSSGTKKPVLNTGLWRYSRHPNYFGELMQWWAIGILAQDSDISWLGLAGPVLLTYLILFVSGIPPIERRRAKDKDYQEYKRRTSILIPLPPKNSVGR